MRITPRIERTGTARDPGAVFENWRDADKPFAFVAACREYVAAKADPENFTTHLPVSFDHTCSGIQHLAMVMRDEKAGALVNVLDADRPQDIYLAVARKLKDKITAAEEIDEGLRSAFDDLSDLPPGKAAKELNKRRVSTPTGKWDAKQVIHVRKRLLPDWWKAVLGPD
jgi:DNA-directed RNA polymerase